MTLRVEVMGCALLLGSAVNMTSRVDEGFSLKAVCGVDIGCCALYKWQTGQTKHRWRTVAVAGDGAGDGMDWWYVDEG